MSEEKYGTGIITNLDHTGELYRFDIGSEPAPPFVFWSGQMYQQWGDDFPNKIFFYCLVPSV